METKSKRSKIALILVLAMVISLLPSNLVANVKANQGYSVTFEIYENGVKVTDPEALKTLDYELVGESKEKAYVAGLNKTVTSDVYETVTDSVYGQQKQTLNNPFTLIFSDNKFHKVLLKYKSPQYGYAYLPANVVDNEKVKRINFTNQAPNTFSSRIAATQDLHISSTEDISSGIIELSWTPPGGITTVRLQASIDNGATYTNVTSSNNTGINIPYDLQPNTSTTRVRGLDSTKKYIFRLFFDDSLYSNTVDYVALIANKIILGEDFNWNQNFYSGNITVEYDNSNLIDGYKVYQATKTSSGSFIKGKILATISNANDNTKKIDVDMSRGTSIMTVPYWGNSEGENALYISMIDPNNVDKIKDVSISNLASTADTNLAENIYKGTISWNPSVDETLIDGYRIYQSSNITSKPTNYLYQIPKSGRNYTQNIDVDLSNGSNIIVLAYNEFLEDNIKASSYINLLDTKPFVNNIKADKDTKVETNQYKGQVSWDRLSDENNIDGYRVYQGTINNNKFTKLQNTPLDEVLKSNETKSKILDINISNNSNYIAVVPYNSISEGTVKNYAALIDIGTIDEQVTGINFTDDSNPTKNNYTGIINWNRLADETMVDGYKVYQAANNSEKAKDSDGNILPPLATVAKADRTATLEIDLTKGKYIIVVGYNSLTEGPVASVEITDFIDVTVPVELENATEDTDLSKENYAGSIIWNRLSEQIEDSSDIKGYRIYQGTLDSNGNFVKLQNGSLIQDIPLNSLGNQQQITTILTNLNIANNKNWITVAAYNSSTEGPMTNKLELINIIGIDEEVQNITIGDDTNLTRNNYQGVISWNRLNDEAVIDGYKIYQGTLNSNNLVEKARDIDGNILEPLATVSKTNQSPSISIDLTKGKYVIVVGYNQFKEGPIVSEILIDAVDIQSSVQYVSAATDTNKAENMYSGLISWGDVANEEDIEGYKVYQGALVSGVMTKVGSPLATVSKNSAPMANVSNIDLNSGNYIIVLPYYSVSEGPIKYPSSAILIDVIKSGDQIAVNVVDTKGKKINDAYITISRTSQPYSDSMSYGDDGEYLFTKVPDGNYTVNLTWRNHTQSKSNVRVILQKGSPTQVNFVVPVMYNVSGQVSLNNGSAIQEDITLKLTNGSNTLFASVDRDGYFTFVGIGENKLGNYTLSVYSPSKFIYKTKTINVNGDVESITLDLKAGSRLVGKLINEAGETPYHFYLTLYRGNTYIARGTYGFLGQDGFLFDGVINQPGEYSLKFENSLREFDGTYYKYYSPNELKFANSDYYTFNVSENQLGQVIDLGKLVYKIKNKNSTIEGSVTADVNTAKIGTPFSVNVTCKNTSSQAVDVNLSALLPNGITCVAGETNNTIHLKPYGELSYWFSVEATPEYKSNIINIPVKYTIGTNTTQYTLGTTNVDLITITLSGPGAVEGGERFKVYGETVEGVTINIKDRDTQNILGTGTVNGYWYSSNIVLKEQRIYNLVAEAVVNGNVEAISNVLTVDCRYGQIAIENVDVRTEGFGSYTKLNLPINYVTGVRSFTVYTYSNVNGYPANLDVTFSDSDNIIQDVSFEFSGMNYTATKSENVWKVRLANWRGAGIKPVTAVVKTKDGRTLKMVVAEAVVLVDPSGYVYNKVTGERIEGAIATCEVFEDNQWKVWEAEKYGQINPQVTTSNGLYGWMVPEGLYRVRITKEGYESYLTTDHPDEIPEIHVLPPRDDVNIGLTPIETPDTNSNSSSSSSSNSNSSNSVNVVQDNKYVKEDNITKTDTGLEIDLRGNTQLLSVSQLNNLIAENTTRPIELKGEKYVIRFEEGAMDFVEPNKDTEGYDFGIVFNKCIHRAIIQSLLDQEAIIAHLNFEGELPAEAEIKIFIGKEYANQSVDYSYYNVKTNKLIFIDTLTVDEDGYITINTTEGADFVFELRSNAEIEE